MTKQFTDKLDEAHKRLLADVDDRMEFLGTVFNPKDHAAEEVAKALAEARQQILTAIDEAIGEPAKDAPPLSENSIVNHYQKKLRQALGISPEDKK